MTRATFWAGVSLVAACTVAACAAPNQTGGAQVRSGMGAISLSPIADPNARLELPGLSILPPRGDKWFLVVPSHAAEVGSLGLVRFARTLRPDRPSDRPEDAHTVLTSVTVTDLKGARFDGAEAFRRATKESLRRGYEENPRHRLLALTVVPDASVEPLCVKYDVKAEDRGVPRFPDSTFILTASGVRCVHPYWPDYLVDVAASQRHLLGYPSIAVDEEVEPVFRSLRFTQGMLRSLPAPVPGWTWYERYERPGLGFAIAVPSTWRYTTTPPVSSESLFERDHPAINTHVPPDLQFGAVAVSGDSAGAGVFVVRFHLWEELPLEVLLRDVREGAQHDDLTVVARRRIRLPEGERERVEYRPRTAGHAHIDQKIQVVTDFLVKGRHLYGVAVVAEAGRGQRFDAILQRMGLSFRFLE